MTIRLTLLAGLLIGLAGAAGDALAQTPGQTTPGIIAPGHVRQQNQSLGQREPGTIVRAGVGRASAAMPDALNIIEITEPERPSGLSALYANVLDILFRDLNSYVAQFHNLLLLRAGRAPSASSSFQSNSSDGGTDLGGLLGQLGGLFGGNN